MDGVYCAIDLETTGVNPYRDAICEIGLVRFDCTGEIPLASYSTLVNPCRSMSPEVIALHGITDEMVKDAPLEKDILAKVYDFIGDYPLVIQNPRFDLSFLQLAFKRIGITLFPDKVYDTVSLSRYAYPELINHKLETVCRHLNINLSFHRALDDAIGCMKVFISACRSIFGGTIQNDELNRICAFNCGENLLRSINATGALEKDRCYMIDYRDRDGIKTQREIRVCDIFRQGRKMVVHAWCYLRKEERYFNYERITNIRGI